MEAQQLDLSLFEPGSRLCHLTILPFKRRNCTPKSLERKEVFNSQVTEVGGPVGPFTELNGKQPFERIVLGIHEKFPNQPSPQEDRIILSVPSALHSHKPPLNGKLIKWTCL